MSFEPSRIIHDVALPIRTFSCVKIPSYLYKYLQALLRTNLPGLYSPFKHTPPFPTEFDTPQSATSAECTAKRSLVEKVYASILHMLCKVSIVVYVSTPPQTHCYCSGWLNWRVLVLRDRPPSLGVNRLWILDFGARRESDFGNN